MARVTKDCSHCGSRQPCTLRVGPLGPQPTTEVLWVVTCATCGNDHPPDATEKVLDAKGWERAKKAANGGVIVLE